MSHFATELKQQLDKRQLSERAAAKATGVSQSQISKWVRGAQTHIGHEHWSQLATLFLDPIDRSQLAAAHLYDELLMPGSEGIVITVNEHGKSGTKRIPSDWESAVQVLRLQAQRSPELRTILVSLAAMFANTPSLNGRASLNPRRRNTTPPRTPKF